MRPVVAFVMMTPAEANIFETWDLVVRSDRCLSQQILFVSAAANSCGA